MKARTDRKTLHSAIRNVSMALKVRPVKQYEECILLNVDDGGMTLIATNGEQRIRQTIECDALEHGFALVDGKMFGALVAKMDMDDVIHLESDEKTLKLRVANQKARMTSIPIEDFPGAIAVEEPNVMSISSADLMTALNGVRYAAAKEMTRLILTGILMEVTKGKLFTVALDGYRLAAFRKPCNHADDGSYVLPGVAAQMACVLASSYDGDAEIRANKSRMSFTFGDIQLDSILFSGNYMDWKQIVPTEFIAEAKVSTEELLSAAELASVATSKSYAIRTELTEDGIHMTANGDVSGTEQLIDGDVAIHGEGAKAAYSASFLSDALKAVTTDEVVFKVTGETRPAVISPVEGNEFLMLVLPVRVRE